MACEPWEYEEAVKLTAAQVNIFWNPYLEKELCHIGKDPDQVTNLALNPEYESVFAKATRRLDRTDGR
ncbi:MAG: hypothetical protein AAGB46_15335 [Verrucomicrobiota bacterium]